MTRVEVKGLVKYYGDYCAVDNVNFSFESGKLTAICGKNGSGKTTAIRCLLGLLKANKLEVLIDGKKQILDNKKVGYLPEERGLFIKEKIDFQLELFAQLKGMNKNDANKAIDYWLEKFELKQYKNKKLESLSKGNQQKIQMIAALIHNPEIIILDEPFSGLDPVNMQVFVDLINSLKKKGKCILISSHQLSLIQGICEDICIINKGKCVFSGSIINLLKEYSSDYLYFSTKAIVKGLNVEEVSPLNYRIKIENYEEFKSKLDEIREVETIGYRKMSLQEIFIELVGNKANVKVS